MKIREIKKNKLLNLMIDELKTVCEKVDKKEFITYETYRNWLVQDYKQEFQKMIVNTAETIEDVDSNEISNKSLFDFEKLTHDFKNLCSLSGEDLASIESYTLEYFNGYSESLEEMYENEEKIKKCRELVTAFNKAIKELEFENDIDISFWIDSPEIKIDIDVPCTQNNVQEIYNILKSNCKCFSFENLYNFEEEESKNITIVFGYEPDEEENTIQAELNENFIF